MKKEFVYYLYDFAVNKLNQKNLYLTPIGENNFLAIFEMSIHKLDIHDIESNIRRNEAINSTEVFVNTIILEAEYRKITYINYEVRDFRNILKNICPLWPFC